MEGRLLAVVDTFDAIMSDRPYRKGAPLADVVAELENNKGKQLDPGMVDVFLDVLRNRGVNFVDLYGREVDMSCLNVAAVTESALA